MINITDTHHEKIRYRRCSNDKRQFTDLLQLLGSSCTDVPAQALEPWLVLAGDGRVSMLNVWFGEATHRAEKIVVESNCRCDQLLIFPGGKDSHDVPVSLLL